MADSPKNGNGLNIEVRREDFMKKPPEEQNWLLYEAVTGIHKSGCQWAKGRYIALPALVSFFAMVGGFLFNAVNRMFKLGL